MKTKLFTVLLSLFSFSVFSQEFLDLSSGITNTISAIHFIDDNTGIAVSYGGKIVKTTNQGENWTPQVSGVSSDLIDVLLLDNATALITGRNGIILKTTNGGTNWSTVFTGITEDLTRLYKNGSDIYASGYNGVILKSVNEGASWIQLTTGTTSPLFQTFFLDADTGFVVGNDGTILKTTDAGQSWSPLNSGTTTQLLCIQFTDANNGFVVGGSGAFNTGIILRTTNGGDTWSSQIINDNFLANIRFLDPLTGFISGGDVVNNISIILKTTDGGNNWVEQLSYSNRQVGETFPSYNVGYTCGLGGTILKVENIDAGLEETKNQSDDITFYPNPTTGKFYLTSENSSLTPNAMVEIYTITGEKILEQSALTEFDLSNKSDGTYFAKISDKNSVYTKLIIKQ